MQKVPIIPFGSRLFSRSWHRHMRQLPVLLSVVLALLLVLSACGGTTGPTTPTAGTCNKSSGFTLASEVSYGAEAAAAFQRQTGIAVQVLPFADHYDAVNTGVYDAIWSDAEIGTPPVHPKPQEQQAYRLLSWDSSALSSYTVLGMRFVPADHAYYPTGLSAAAAIVYNRNHLPAAGLPTTWTDLEKPAYKNRVAETSIFWSNVTYEEETGISQLLGGEAQGNQFLLNLKNNGAVFPATDQQTLQLVESGARDVGIVGDASYYLAKHQGQTLGIIYPASGVIGLTTDLGILARSPHQACAEQFVNWVLSPAGQTVLIHHDPNDAATYFIPLIRGITPVVSRQSAGITFVPYHVQKWIPLALSDRLWVNSHVQSAHSAVSPLLPGGDGSSCNDNCSLCDAHSCDP